MLGDLGGMSIPFRPLVAVWALCTSLTSPLPAQAAEQKTTDEATEINDEGVVLETIFVSARKREEDLQQVPIQIDAYTSIELEGAGIETPELLIGLTSNMTYGNSFTVGNSYVTLRGVTQLPNSDPPVAVVVDEVYQANNKQLNQELFDVERIEILKGPQGSIYGRNALGGVINIITKEPTAAFSGSVLAGLAEGNTSRLTGSVNGALGSDKVLARLSGSHKESDGQIRNEFLKAKADAYEDTTVRVRLRFFPSEQVSLDLRAQTSATDGGAVLYSLVPTDGGANRFDIGPDESFLGFSEREVDEFTALLNWVTKRWSLTAISGLADLGETYRGDLDFSNPVRFPDALSLAQGQDLDVSYFSQEVRLSSVDDQEISWLAGAYYLRTDRKLTSIPYFDTTGTVDGLIPLLFIGEDNDNTAYALFGQADVPVGEKLILNLGLRYDRDEREQVDIINGGSRGRSFDDWQPRLTLSYASSPGLLGYLSLARGFRSGGYNAPTIAPDFFREESANSFEIGFKAMFGEGRTRLNGAAYLTQVDDFQVFEVDALAAQQITTNINEVEIRGLELDLRARLSPWVDLFAAFGLNDSSIEDFDSSGRFEGNQTPNNVRWTGNVGASAGRPISDTLAFSGRVDVELRGKQYWHPDNLDVTDERRFVNLRLGIESAKWSVTAWARNLTDEAYWAEYFDATWGGVPSGLDLAHPGRPRSVGADVRLRF